MTSLHGSALALVITFSAMACNKTAATDDGGVSATGAVTGAVGTVAATAVDPTPAPPAAVTDTDTTDDTATAPPPAPPVENPGPPPAPNNVWAQGAWHFTGAHYLWTRGHWEAPHPGMTLAQAKWVEANGKWERHPARWTKEVAVEHPMEHPEVHPNEHPVVVEHPPVRPPEHR